MAIEINEFSDDSIREIAKVVRQLRWRVQNIAELVKAVRRFRPTHEIRTGITKAKPQETYPAGGCVLPVQFQDLDFSEVVGQSDPLTRTPWPLKFVSARTYDDQYLAENTDVLIVKTPAKKGRRWWILTLERHYKAKITELPHHVPAHDYSVHLADLMIFDPITEDWVAVLEDGQNKRIEVWDRNSDCCVLVGEMHDVKPTNGPDGITKWHWVGEAGLTREAVVTQDAEAGADISAFLVYHPEDSDCAGEVTVEPITVCNKGGAVKAIDRIVVSWVENVWITAGGRARPGKISFQAITNRTRETANGLLFGRAQVIIQDIEGVVPHVRGQQVEVILPSRLYLGQVRGCLGTAEWYPEEQKYIVDECQTLAAWIRFRTTEDRDPAEENQDVAIELLEIINDGQSGSTGGGLDNATYPPDDYLRGFSGGGGGGGTSQWKWVAPGIWEPISDQCGQGCTPVPPPDLPPGEEYYGNLAWGTCDCNGGGGNQSSGLKVRYDGLEYPRALEGAEGKALLDIDYETEVGEPTMKYHVVVSNQESPLQRVGTPEFCPYTDVTANEWAAMMEYPFGQTPVSAPTAQELFGLATEGGAGVFAWDKTLQGYIVLQTTLSTVSMVTDLRWSEDCNVEGLKVSAQVYKCSQPQPEWEELLEFTPRTYVQNFQEVANSDGSTCVFPVYATMYVPPCDRDATVASDPLVCVVMCDSSQSSGTGGQ